MKRDLLIKVQWSLGDAGQVFKGQRKSEFGRALDPVWSGYFVLTYILKVDFKNTLYAYLGPTEREV